MFSSFLKVADACGACGEELHHQRADDFPAYIVVAIVGHVLLSATLWLEMAYAPPLWVAFSMAFPISIAMTLLLLQPVKGVVVAIQWRMGMDGFAASAARRAASSQIGGIPRRVKL